MEIEGLSAAYLDNQLVGSGVEDPGFIITIS